MKIEANGVDCFYIDESEKTPLSVVTSVRIPLIRPKNGEWHFVWDDYLKKAVEWRRNLSKKHHIRFRKELHGYEILRREGLYHRDGRNLTHEEALALYRDALATLTWLPMGSVMSAYATNETELMGHKGILACLY